MVDGNKKWQILYKVFLQSLRVGFFSLFPNEDHLEFLCATKSKLLCLGGLMGKNFTLD